MMSHRWWKKARASRAVALAVTVGVAAAAGAASPVQVLGVYKDSVTIAWRPVGADVKAWDSQLMPYPAPTSYITGSLGYPRITQGPSDGEVPKFIEAYTYQSFNGRPVAAALVFSTWGYRVSWFEQKDNGFVCRGSFLVPALWIRERGPTGDFIYHEVQKGRYTLCVPPKGALKPDTRYQICVEPLKLIVHEWLDFEDASVCVPSFSPLIPSDITFQPLVILWPKGPQWYYGLTRLSNCDEFPGAEMSYAGDMPPLSFNTPPRDRSRYHYEGPDMPQLGDFQDPWTSRVYWWVGQPASEGNGQGGSHWYPVCGVRGYVKRGGMWESFGAQGPRVMAEVSVRTQPEPFEVVSTSPQNGERGVKPDARVVITLNKPITYLNSGAIRWTDSSGKALLFAAQVDGRELRLRPQKPLSQDTDYRIVLPRGAVKSDGQTLAADFAFSFSTKPPSGGGGGGHGQAQ